MRKTIAMIEGDYSGPEVVREAVKVMKRTAEVFGHEFVFKKVLMGGEAIDATGVPLPDETLKECLASDSVLLGAVGGPKYNAVPKDKRPERGLLALRSGMELFANLRPARVFPQLSAASLSIPAAASALSSSGSCTCTAIMWQTGGYPRISL